MTVTSLTVVTVYAAGVTVLFAVTAAGVVMQWARNRRNEAAAIKQALDHEASVRVLRAKVKELTEAREQAS